MLPMWPFAPPIVALKETRCKVTQGKRVYVRPQSIRKGNENVYTTVYKNTRYHNRKNASFGDSYAHISRRLTVVDHRLEMASLLDPSHKNAAKLQEKEWLAGHDRRVSNPSLIFTRINDLVRHIIQQERAIMPLDPPENAIQAYEHRALRGI